MAANAGPHGACHHHLARSLILPRLCNMMKDLQRGGMAKSDSGSPSPPPGNVSSLQRRMAKRTPVCTLVHGATASPLLSSLVFQVISTTGHKRLTLLCASLSPLLLVDRSSRQ
ncbi:hypothetical protein IG631_08661 [Alternaria alternata]|nr:hypothetical protein IG631_08661 [Alternaria alternata]